MYLKFMHAWNTVYSFLFLSMLKGFVKKKIQFSKSGAVFISRKKHLFSCMNLKQKFKKKMFLKKVIC